MEYVLTTIKKGEIKSVDSFITNFKSMGANMKALSVSAYKFLTSEDKEVKKEFRCRVMDELNMTKATLSYLKTAGELYTLDDRFSEFAYTNVIFFKKVVESLEEKDDAHLSQMFENLALMHNSYAEEDTYITVLASLSQKELKNLIDKYMKKDEVVDDVEDAEETEETEDTDEEPGTSEDEVEEVNGHYVTYLDDEIDSIICLIDGCLENNKISKTALLDALKDIRSILDGNANK